MDFPDPLLHGALDEFLALTEPVQVRSLDRVRLDDLPDPKDEFSSLDPLIARPALDQRGRYMNELSREIDVLLGDVTSCGSVRESIVATLEHELERRSVGGGMTAEQRSRSANRHATDEVRKFSNQPVMQEMRRIAERLSEAHRKDLEAPEHFARQMIAFRARELHRYMHLYALHLKRFQDIEVYVPSSELQSQTSREVVDRAMSRIDSQMAPGYRQLGREKANIRLAIDGFVGDEDALFLDYLDGNLTEIRFTQRFRSAGSDLAAKYLDDLRRVAPSMLSSAQRLALTADGFLGNTRFANAVLYCAATAEGVLGFPVDSESLRRRYFLRESPQEDFAAVNGAQVRTRNHYDDGAQFWLEVNVESLDDPQKRELMTFMVDSLKGFPRVPKPN